MPDIERSLLHKLSMNPGLGRSILDNQIVGGAIEGMPQTILFDGNQLANIRSQFGDRHQTALELVNPLWDQADQLLTIQLPSVCDKSHAPFGGEKNDYISLERNCWSVNKSDGTVAYEIRDRSVNPECFAEHFDYLRLTKMVDAATTLALAAYISKDSRYGLKAAAIMESWFLSPKLAQTPHFQHAQIRPGRDAPSGEGVIEGRSLIYICDAAAMLSIDGHLSLPQMAKLRAWFRDVLDWMLNSPEGSLAAKAEPNVALWYQIQSYSFAQFCDDETTAQASLASIVSLAREQITPDRTTPSEMVRRNPHDHLAYSLIAAYRTNDEAQHGGTDFGASSSNARRTLAAVHDWLMAIRGASDTKTSLSDSGAQEIEAYEIDEKFGLAIAVRLLIRGEKSLVITGREIAFPNQQPTSLHSETEALPMQSDAVHLAMADIKSRYEESEQERRNYSKLNRALKRKYDALIHKNQQLRFHENTQRRSRKKLNKLLALLALPYFIVALPITGPLLLWYLFRRRNKLLHRFQKAMRSGRKSLRARQTPIDPAEFYPKSPIDSEADTFALYRIIGNDLVPRHAEGQSLKNVSFILENEPPLQDCQKLWVLNRIRDEQEKTRIAKLLKSAGHEVVDIPFNHDEYRQIGWDFDAFPTQDFLATKEFSLLKPEERLRAQTAVYRLKNMYLMHNNGARNVALAEGAKRAKWVLPLDGNCFVTQQAWSEIRQSVAASPQRRYFIVPMQRITNNSELLKSDFNPNPLEEPQIIVRRDAPERFNPEFPYGRRPKVELLWRLGVPGPWDRWEDDQWDQTRRAPAPDAGYVGTAGWVARLSSGMESLENQKSSASFSLRGAVRDEAIVATIDDADLTIAQTDDLAFYPEAALVRLANATTDDTALVNIRDKLLTTAEKALEAGVFSVVDKSTVAPSGDIHDYWHPAPYWWPDPSKPDGRPYILRDGERVAGTKLYEPESDQFDRTRLQQMFDNTTIVSLAAKVSGRRDFAEHGARLIRTWFINPQTKMSPHLRYAQVRRGLKNDEGAATGIIEFKDLYFFLDAVRILERLGALSSKDSDSFRDWLTEYQDWLESSEQGRDECAKTNNHGTYFDLQAAAIAAYLEDQQRLRTIYFRTHSRLTQQIRDNGEQPEEMKRTLSQHYVHFNLQGLLNIFKIMQSAGRPAPLQDRNPGMRLTAALEWIFRQERDTWPSQQIEPFDHDRTAVLAAAATSLGVLPQGRSPITTAIGDIKPIFDPYSAVRPFWMLS